MTEITKKIMIAGLIVICIAGAIVVSYSSLTKKRVPKGDFQESVFCVACGGFEISENEYREMMHSVMFQGPPTQTELMNTVYKCPKCQKRTCRLALKCPKCEKIFLFGQARDPQFNDRCPACSYSPSEKKP